MARHDHRSSSFASLGVTKLGGACQARCHDACRIRNLLDFWHVEGERAIFALVRNLKENVLVPLDVTRTERPGIDHLKIGKNAFYRYFPSDRTRKLRNQP
jgi:hypothetical protein